MNSIEEMMEVVYISELQQVGQDFPGHVEYIQDLLTLERLDLYQVWHAI